MRPSPSLHIIARSTGGDNPKNRPAYYTKFLCLRSLLDAATRLGDLVRFTFVNDGAIPADRLSEMERHGTIVPLPGVGNSPSYRRAMEIALHGTPEEFVYFAEDDYLYLEESFTSLVAAFDDIPSADYITLFDHRDRYTRHDDAHRGYSRIVIAAARHWRTVDSTCMTFGARTAVFRNDAWLHRLATVPNTPRDRLLWHALQGQRWFWWKYPKRRLFGPMPSLATHMDPHGLAPIVAWEDVARRVLASVPNFNT